jgi:hypothetical protein
MKRERFVRWGMVALLAGGLATAAGAASAVTGDHADRSALAQKIRKLQALGLITRPVKPVSAGHGKVSPELARLLRKLYALGLIRPSNPSGQEQPSPPPLHASLASTGT